MNRKIPEKIYHAALIAVRKKVTDAFNDTRRIVPVRTGRLKSSGKNEILTNGSETIFKAPYASFVERGTRAGIRSVKGYYRRDGTYVKEHSYFSRGQRAQHYIENPLKENLKDGGLAEEFEQQLRNEGFKVSKK